MVYGYMAVAGDTERLTCDTVTGIHVNTVPTRRDLHPATCLSRELQTHLSLFAIKVPSLISLSL